LSFAKNSKLFFFAKSENTTKWGFFNFQAVQKFWFPSKLKKKLSKHHRKFFSFKTYKIITKLALCHEKELI